MMMMMMTT